MNQIIGSQFNPHFVGDVSTEAATTYMRAVQAMLRQDYQRGLASLDELFRSGDLPNPQLQGRFVGQFIAFDIAPGLNWLATFITSDRAPWLGKTIDAARQRGEDLYKRNTLWLTRLIWPFHRKKLEQNQEIYRAFLFDVRIGESLADPEQKVLKLDYNRIENPRLSIRRTLSEVVELANGYYLGKSFIRWWWGRWQPVAYFVLRPVVFCEIRNDR